ncbi:hypothetical protein F4810DRAFT_659610 [Camillea tinctor]|nr:hypothetical protein F4810DRAFT_659610 [Camillea tinctor]
MAIHIMSFTDATIVGISFPHSMMDAGGLATLLAEWSAVVNCRPSNKVRPLAGARKDIVGEIIKKLHVKSTMQNNSLVQEAGKVYEKQPQNKPDRVLNTDLRLIFIPKNFLLNVRKIDERLRKRSFLEDDAFDISDAEVLMAWVTRSMCLWRSKSSLEEIPVWLRTTLNLRDPKYEYCNPDEAYVQNLRCQAATQLSVFQIGKYTIGETARLIRTSLRTQTRSFIQAKLKLWRDTYIGGTPDLFGFKDNATLEIEDFTPARLYEAVNFKNAVAPGYSRHATAGSCVFYHTLPPKRYRGRRELFYIYGQDLEGNFWLAGYMEPKAWDMIERELHSWK